MAEDTHDESLQINVTFDPKPPKRLGFGNALLIAPLANSSMQAGDKPVKAYEDPTAVGEDWTTAEEAAANVFFGQEPEPNELLIGEWDKAGTETLDTALNNILDADDGFYGVVTSSRTDSEQEALSTEVEAKGNASGSAMKLMMLWLQSGLDDIVTSQDLSATNFTSLSDRERTILDYHTTDSEWLGLGHAARILPYDQDRKSPPHFCDISGVADYSGLPSSADIGTQQAPGKARGNGANIALPFGSVDTWLAPGQNTASRQAKVVMTRDWFEQRLQTDVAFYIQEFRKEGEGVPAGEAGTQKTSGQTAMAGLLKSRYKQGARNGHFLPDNLEVTYPTVLQSDVDNGIIPLEAEMTVEIAGQAVTFDVNFSRSPVG